MQGEGRWKKHTAPVGADVSFCYMRGLPQINKFSLVFIAVGWTMLCIRFSVT